MLPEQAQVCVAYGNLQSGCVGLPKYRKNELKANKNEREQLRYQ
jgi:hypothetical protein